MGHIVETHGQFFNGTLTLEVHLMKINQAMIHKADSIPRLKNGNNWGGAYSLFDSKALVYQNQAYNKDLC